MGLNPHIAMRVNSLAARLVLGASVWCAIVLVAGGVLLSQLFRDYVVRNFDARLAVHLENLAAVSDVLADSGLKLERELADPRFGQPYSGLYWQISHAEGVLLRSRSLWDTELERAPPGAVTASSYADQVGPSGQRLRVMSRAIALSESDQRFVFQVAADTAEHRAEIQRFDRALVRSLSVLGIGLLSAVLVQVHFGLRPLRRIREALAAIRSGSAARMEPDLPSEIAPLADELNALLEHNEDIVERARTHVGNLAHALKTPLSVLHNESRNQRAPLARLVARQTELMREHVDHYLARARAAGSARVISAHTGVAEVVEGIARTLRRVHAERELEIDAHCDAALLFKGERQDLEEIVGNLADNACKWAARRVSIRAERQDGQLALRIEDDGPGLPEERRHLVLQRGKRLDEKVAGSGLGLSIVKDIVELYGGRVVLGDAALGGLRVEVTLPAVTPPRP